MTVEDDLSDNEDLGLQLTKAELKKVARHFNNHIGERTCHICGSKHWQPLGSVHTSVVFDRVNNHHRQDRVIPHVSVACMNCGAITSFLAGIVGIPHRDLEIEPVVAEDANESDG